LYLKKTQELRELDILLEQQELQSKSNENLPFFKCQLKQLREKLVCYFMFFNVPAIVEFCDFEVFVGYYCVKHD